MSSEAMAEIEKNRLAHKRKVHEAAADAAAAANFGSGAPGHQASSAGASTEHPEDLVQLLAGTDTRFYSEDAKEWYQGAISSGQTLPQIKTPWGFNDWAPQTRESENLGPTGQTPGGEKAAWWFSPKDKTFQGMRCTHQPSPFLGDYGHFLLQPHTEDRLRDLAFDVEKSTFRPYLFNTTLEGMGFEFVPTSHAALLQVTFPMSAKAGHLSLRITDGDLRVDGGTTLRGRTNSSGGEGVPMDWQGMWFTVKALTKTTDSEYNAGLNDTYANSRRGTIHFDPSKGPHLVALATSFISQEQSDLNLEQEVGKKTFQEVLTETRKQWHDQLRRVQVTALDETQLSIFYTNLWKAQLFPRFLQEVNADKEEVHRSPYTSQVEKGKLVTDSGFWDSYSTVYPLQSLIFADNLGSLIDGHVKAYKEATWLPQWASPGERNMMCSTLGDVSLADAIAKSKWGFLTGFNVSDAYAAIRKDAFAPDRYMIREGDQNSTDPHAHLHFGRLGLKSYIDNGYVEPKFTRNNDQVSLTLDYYISDAAISRAAGLLGKHEDEQLLYARSQRYPVLFNPETKFFQPKQEGQFVPFFNPEDFYGFTEASAWQYRFFLPHDVEGLKKLYGGTLCDNIQDMMSYSAKHPEKRPHGDARFPKTFGLYWHGNQPVHHILWVAKKAGCADVADKYLRKVMQLLYTKDGWAGDEDNGEMSSWYILSALGVYSLEGAKDELVLGSPAIKQATVLLQNDKVLNVNTENQADDHVYVQSVTWTPVGPRAWTEDMDPSEYNMPAKPKVMKDNVIKFTELMQGGNLTFRMGALPKPPASPSEIKPRLYPEEERKAPVPTPPPSFKFKDLASVFRDDYQTDAAEMGPPIELDDLNSVQMDDWSQL